MKLQELHKLIREEIKIEKRLKQIISPNSGFLDIGSLYINGRVHPIVSHCSDLGHGGDRKYFEKGLNRWGWCEICKYYYHYRISNQDLNR